MYENPQIKFLSWLYVAGIFYLAFDVTKGRRKNLSSGAPRPWSVRSQHLTRKEGFFLAAKRARNSRSSIDQKNAQISNC